MSKESNLDKIKNLPEFTKQFGGLVIIILIVISSFFVLNIMFGGGDELVRKMKLEEERIAQEKKLSELISKLPSGILVTFDGTDHFKLSDEDQKKPGIEIKNIIGDAYKEIAQDAIRKFLNQK